MAKVFDVMQHALVPRHEVLTEAEAQEVLERYGIVADQLPRLNASDPVARAIRARPGQIVRVRRKSPTALEHVAYRLVIEG